VVKKKFRTLVIQEGKSTISFLEKFQNLLNQMDVLGWGWPREDGAPLWGINYKSYKAFNCW